MAKNVRVLVVAGGGSGGTSAGGGGGAGGFRDVASQALVAGSYAVTVGGAGGNSSFGSLIVSNAGGRGGIDRHDPHGQSGGSGGGGAGVGAGYTEGNGGAGTVGQGNAGAAGREGNSLGPPNDRDAVGGGGGGAGGAGSTGGDHTGGNGGAGATSNITGATVTYAAGGGGAGPGGNGTGGAATANTGNGGTAASGQSGVVIIRYLTSDWGIVTGGTITTSGTDTIHTFTTSGTFSIADPGSYRPAQASFEAFIVAGGGGGGTPAGWGSGGGGAGGYIHRPIFIPEEFSYNVIVGTGGARATNGGDSYFTTDFVAVGGGSGAPDGDSYGNPGGSGGGGYGTTSGNNGTPGGTGTVGQGYNGGPGRSYTSGTTSQGAGGGGGGATSAGGSSNGGNGITNPISGVAVCGGGRGDNGSDGTGASGYGGGGPGDSIGGAGQNGVVQFKYKTSEFGSCTGGTITIDGDYTINTFTTSGTFAITYVTTQDSSNITYNSADFSGEVVSGGGPIIVERGICYSTVINPTIGSIRAISAGTTGDFTSSLSGLSPGTTYYVRAYVTDAVWKTTYGTEKSFVTLGVPPNTIVKDIDGVEGQTYAVRLYVGGTTGTVVVKLGSTGYSETFTAGDGYVTLQGVYSGLLGLIFESGETFDGYIDNVSWVIVVGSTTIDWDSTLLTNILPINSSVKFKRTESEEITQFLLYRYLDILFKDLDGYVTLTLTEEANDSSADRSKTFVVSNTESSASPFIKKKISMLSKNQALIVSFSNNNLNETFTVCQFSLTGEMKPKKLYKVSKIISI